jgi:hypothetical protein
MAVFARTALELDCRRPDIPLLVVEARGNKSVRVVRPNS